jgi:AbrB family looped-hinge helix DNA binding protein
LQKKARITSKGQITVPREIRRLLGVSPGDSLVFEGDRERVRVRPVKARSPFARYRGIGNPGIQSGRQAILRWIRTLRGE